MEWLERVSRLRRWTRGGERDPHKALLLLYAIGQLQRTGYKPIRFRETEQALDQLFAEFGPPKIVGPSLPFYHLAADGLWEVATGIGGPCPGPERELMIAADVHGRLAPEFAKEMLTDPGLLALIVRILLDTNFEPSLHMDLCAAAGLMPEVAQTAGIAKYVDGRLPRSPRDPMIRQKILVAYDCRCAFCGYEGWFGNAVIGLEVARLRWWAFEGRDDMSNCLCLCTLHHRLFDKGVLGITPSGKITVSRHFVGTTDASRDFVLNLSGRAVRPPQQGFAKPDVRNVDWHTRQVFRGPARITN
ncbi:HNH endonuclease [Actinocorallia lasiicapitis]